MLIACDGHFYGGKTLDIRDKVRAVADAMPSLEKIIVVPYRAEADGTTADVTAIPKAVLLDDYTATYTEKEIDFARLPFNHPLYIMFSSGTTGLPKCIVHGAGGTLLQHLKEHRLHSDIKPEDKVFYFTTRGWMMWNWLVTTLAS